MSGNSGGGNDNDQIGATVTQCHTNGNVGNVFACNGYSDQRC